MRNQNGIHWYTAAIAGSAASAQELGFRTFLSFLGAMFAAERGRRRCASSMPSYQDGSLTGGKMRRAARVDANQAQIVDALRKAGWSVQSIASMGGGVPDLLIGRGGVNGVGGQNLLIEVKDGAKPKSQRMLTEDERQWHASWNGSVRIVESLKDIQDLLS